MNDICMGMAVASAGQNRLLEEAQQTIRELRAEVAKLKDNATKLKRKVKASKKTHKY